MFGEPQHARIQLELPALARALTVRLLYKGGGTYWPELVVAAPLWLTRPHMGFCIMGAWRRMFPENKTGAPSKGASFSTALLELAVSQSNPQHQSSRRVLRNHRNAASDVPRRHDDRCSTPAFGACFPTIPNVLRAIGLSLCMGTAMAWFPPTSVVTPFPHLATFMNTNSDKPGLIRCGQPVELTATRADYLTRDIPIVEDSNTKRLLQSARTKTDHILETCRTLALHRDTDIPMSRRCHRLLR